MKETPYGFGDMVSIERALEEAGLGLKHSLESVGGGFCIESSEPDQPNQLIRVCFTNWRSPVSSFIDIAYVLLVVENLDKKNPPDEVSADPNYVDPDPRYLYYYVGFAYVETINKNNKPSLRALVKQLTKFIVDSRRAPADRYYKTQQDNYGSFPGGLAQVAVNYVDSEDYEAQMLADLPHPAEKLS